jgi:ribosomal protein S18 acetylase RimI-like enzyme
MQPDARTRISVRRTHLELRSLDDLRPARSPAEPVELVRRPRLPAVEYLQLYALVGELWLWRDRLVWARDELERYLASPDVHIWTAHVKGATAGYFELRQHADRSVEVMYFGLAPAFFGRGIGGWLLTRAVEEAFALGAPRIVLNTCTLDAPQALPNYLARGFTIVSEDQYLLDVSARTSRETHPAGRVATRS